MMFAPRHEIKFEEAFPLVKIPVFSYWHKYEDFAESHLPCTDGSIDSWHMKGYEKLEQTWLNQIGSRQVSD